MSQKIDSVCIVDDDEVYRFVTTKEIEMTQMVSRIFEFPNGERAIAFFKNLIENIMAFPDIVFLDINMPVMDGWQFLEHYVTLTPSVPKPIVIYLISSSVDNRDIDRARRISEVTDYIIKPISRNRLTDIFRSLLDR